MQISLREEATKDKTVHFNVKDFSEIAPAEEEEEEGIEIVDQGKKLANSGQEP